MFDVVSDLSNAFEHESLWTIVGAKFRRVLEYEGLQAAVFDRQRRLTFRGWRMEDEQFSESAGGSDWPSEILKTREAFLVRPFDTAQGLAAMDVRLAARGEDFGVLRFLSPRRFDPHDSQVACECCSHLALALHRVRNSELLSEAQRHSEIALTDLAAHADQLHDCNEALRRSNSALREFAYVAGHDLQEPLRMVSIYTELLLNNKSNSEDEKSRFAGIIRSGVVRMGDLIKDLMLYSRVVRERGMIAHVDLNTTLNEATAALAEKIQESGAQITHSDLPAVDANPHHLSVVFENLLSNAIKYKKPDVAPEIRVSAARVSDEWLVTVSDNGIGFSPLHEERIFGLFKRLHRDAYPGTGLGLAICRTIVEQYGGQIWAHSDGDGLGASFTLSFPAAR